MARHKTMKEVHAIISKYFTDYDIDQKKSGHYQVVLRAGGMLRKVSMSSSPSDHRTIKNFESHVKRAADEISAGTRSL